MVRLSRNSPRKMLGHFWAGGPNSCVFGLIFIAVFTWYFFGQYLMLGSYPIMALTFRTMGSLFPIFSGRDHAFQRMRQNKPSKLGWPLDVLPAHNQWLKTWLPQRDVMTSQSSMREIQSSTNFRMVLIDIVIFACELLLVWSAAWLANAPYIEPEGKNRSALPFSSSNQVGPLGSILLNVDTVRVLTPKAPDYIGVWSHRNHPCRDTAISLS